MSNWADTLWNDFIVARFKVLIQERPWSGYPAIAATLTREFNVPLTKNACIGKAKREGFAPRMRAKPGGKRGEYDILPPLLRPNPRDKRKPAATRGKLVTFWQLEPHHCRWPYGERPLYLYCAKPVLEDCSWCAEHARICFPSYRRAL